LLSDHETELVSEPFVPRANPTTVHPDEHDSVPNRSLDPTTPPISTIAIDAAYRVPITFGSTPNRIEIPDPFEQRHNKETEDSIDEALSTHSFLEELAAQ
jgi:hypothetical protein